MTAVIILIALIGGILLVCLIVAGIFNGLVRLRNQVENAWAQIDVQLKRRCDLIPNLVETVKGYAKHESGTLEKVIQARNMALAAKTVGERAEAENVLSGTLKSLFAVAEKYPDLKANQNFLALQGELSSLESEIQLARRYYNGAARNYNIAVQAFPSNIVASASHFGAADYFQLAESERETPKVSF